MPSPSSSFLRQLSAGRRPTSKRWTAINNYHTLGNSCSLNQMEWSSSLYGATSSGDYVNGLVMRKRVMVVVDQTSYSKHAMMWALTHSANKGDILTLLHVITNKGSGERGSTKDDSCSPYLVNSLRLLCKASKPEVEIEALVIQGPALATIMSQVKKLDVAVLVLGQKKYSPLFNPLINCFCGTIPNEEFVEQCIKSLECLTIGVRKQSKGVSGYLITTKWQKDFWLLA